MGLNMRTTSKLVHRTVITHVPEFGARQDGGLAFLNEVIAEIRQEKQVGRLTVDFGVGGGVGNISFEETASVSQRDLALLA